MLPRLRSQGTRVALGMVLEFAGAGCALRPRSELPPVSSAAPAPEPGLAPRAGSAPSVPADWPTYVVQPGDVLARIGACRGISVADLARVNGIPDPDRIAAGARLRVPAQDLCAGGRDARFARASAPPRATSAERKRSQPAPPTAPGLLAEFRRGEELLAAARASYDAADFGVALRGAEIAAEAFARAGASPGATSQRARAHVLAAMAAAGLEERERAVAELGRAFALDPDVDLAPEDQSPRLRELVELARGDGGP